MMPSQPSTVDSLLVRATASWVAGQSKHVVVDISAIDSASQKIVGSFADIKRHAAGFDKEMHFCDGGHLTVQYLLVVDALNFCFWPDGELEYEQLAGGIKASLLKDPDCLNATSLANIDGPGVRQLLGWKRDLPEQEERARLLREVGRGLLQHFNGQASELVAAARQSAVSLVQLITAQFPGFRDHAIYKGRQVFFYKRAQIFVGDVYGAFAGQGMGAFSDINQLTMFADYRVPVVLRLLGVLQYSQELARQVDGQQELAAGCEAEIELRAASIMAVELLKDAANKQLKEQHEQQQQQQQRQQRQQQGVDASAGPSANGSADAGQQGAEAPQLLSIQLDWWLWHEGERMRAEHPPHHRTRTIYY